MTAVISEKIATYLQAQGVGTLGENLYYEYSPDDDRDVTAVYDLGGQFESTLRPDDWREIFIQHKCKTHADGYAKIWGILNLVLYPTDGSIVVGSDIFYAKFSDIPKIDDRDPNGLYAFGFTITIQRAITITDPWLDALVEWTKDTLGPTWAVYSAISGSTLPQVTWTITDYDMEQMAPSMFKVSKTFKGIVIGYTPNDQLNGVNKIIEKLGDDVKILFDAGNKRYLTISGVGANVKIDDQMAGIISVTLSKRSNRPFSDAPIMNGVHYREE